jgi:hypothetical protein
LTGLREGRAEIREEPKSTSLNRQTAAIERRRRLRQSIIATRELVGRFDKVSGIANANVDRTTEPLWIAVRILIFAFAGQSTPPGLRYRESPILQRATPVASDSGSEPVP